jgi:GH24 family phage-related lysozyme (muramidase)
MKPSINAVKLIKSFEKLHLKSYKAVETEEKYTIGWGHYGVKEGLTITKVVADAILLKDIEKAQKAVDKFMSVYHFNQNQYDALVSFAFNEGSIDKLVCDGFRSKVQIAKAMLRYNKSGGEVLNGLIKRRKKELKLYNKRCK